MTLSYTVELLNDEKRKNKINKKIYIQEEKNKKKKPHNVITQQANEQKESPEIKPRRREKTIKYD
jgi:hypothetical protein